MKRFALLCVLSVLCASSLFAADLTITAANVASSGAGQAGVKNVSGVAGATLTAGQVVYYDGATNTYKPSATNSSTTNGAVGIALNGASANQPVQVCTADPAFALGATLVIGDTIWLSTNAGGVTKTQSDIATTGNYIVVLGVAISTTQINLNITRAGAAKP